MSKALIKDYMEKVWNEKNADAIDDFFHPEVKIHSPLGKFSDPQEMKNIVLEWLTAIPDMKVFQLHLLEEGGLILSHWEAKGTHLGEIHGMKAKGKPIQYQGTTLYKVKDGKIIEYWAYVDTWSLDKQLK